MSGKYDKHDEKLDKMLGFRVRLTFRDGEVKEGKLMWQRQLDPNHPRITPFSYYILKDDGLTISFRKSQVEKCEKIWGND